MPNASAVPASNVLAGETELRLGGSVVDGDGGSQNSLFLGLRIAGLGIRCMVGKLIAQVIAAGIIVTAYGVYWIGLEAVQGTVVANAVRLASTGTTYSHCNQWLADGTASLIQRKPGVAEATVHVQAQESPDIAENEPQACPWAGCSTGTQPQDSAFASFVTSCDSSARTVMISRDGDVSSKPAPKTSQ